DGDLRDLASLLVDAVDSGAAVSFLAPLSLDFAEEWWRNTMRTANSKAIFFAARNAEGIVGTVQLHPAWAPNQPHRAEVAKLLVHRRYRGLGIGTELMQSLENAARDAGFRLLTLDAKEGAGADRLYRRLGWNPVGVIPRFAFDPDGITQHSAII